MKQSSISATRRTLLVASFGLLGLGQEALVEGTSSTLSHDELVQMSLIPLEEFNMIRSSETKVDFGGLASKGEEEKLWEDAAIFEYEVSAIRLSSRCCFIFSSEQVIAKGCEPDLFFHRFAGKFHLSHGVVLF